MLVARSFASVVELLAKNSGLVGDAQAYQGGLSVLGYVLPDLGALDVRGVALYGVMEFLPGDWWLHVISAFVYAAGLLVLACVAIERKSLT